jgi:hypothetical protein
MRPFSTRRSAEITSAPKTYAFDTGFVFYFRGWHQLREDDLGHLLEHWVLNEMQSHLQSPIVRYWRDKRGHEVNFVLALRGRKPLTVECKWKAEQFEPENLMAFRNRYPEGQNWIVCQDVDLSHSRSYDRLKVDFIGLRELGTRLRRLTR